MLSALFKKDQSDHDDFLFNSSPEVILYLDLKGRITKVNKRVYDWLQISPKDLEGKRITDLAILSPESKELIKKNFLRRLRGENVEPYDISCYKKNGEVEVGRVTAKLIKKKGFPVGIVVLIANVTELEKTLKEKLLEVRENEVRYKGLFDNIRSAAVICEYSKDKESFKIKEVNSHLLKLEKRNKKDTIGKKLRTLFPGVPKEEVCKVVTKAWQDSSGFVDFTFDIAKDENNFIREGRVYKIPTEELVVLYEDATVEVERQQKIEDNEKKFRSIFENANDAIFLMKGKDFIDCNSKTLEIYGCTKKSDIVGKTPLDFSPEVQPDGLSSKRKALKLIRAALNGRPQKFYWQHSKKNSELFDAEVALKKLVLGGEVYIQAIVRDISEQSKLISQLKETRDNQKLAEKVAKVGHWVWYMDDNELIWSDQVYEIFEVSKSNPPSYETFLSMIHEDDQKAVKKMVDQAVKNKEVYKIDHRIKVGDSKIKVVHEQGQAFYDQKGKPYKIVGVVRDITRQKEADYQLKKSEEKFRNFFNNSRDAIFVADAETRKLVDCNNRAVELMGYSKNKLLTMTADELHPSDKVKEAIESFQLQAEGKIDIIETEILCRDKKRIPVSVTTSIHEGSDGKKYAQGVFRDISERVEYINEIAESESRFKSIIENAEAIIFMIDKNGDFLLSEGQKLSVLGLKPGEVVGTSAFEMYKEYPSVIKGIKTALKGEVVKNIIQVGEVYFDIFFSPYRNANNEIIGVLGMAVDVTDSELALAKLVEIDKKKNEFIGMASHQLRTPLGNMRWSIEGLMAAKEYQDDAKLIKSLKDVYSANLRLIDLVSNLLNVSKIESERVMDRPVEMDLTMMIREIIMELNNQIEDKNLQVKLNMPSKMVIKYDPKLLREVIGNLITNAVKFNKQSGMVVIILSRNGAKFRLDVANTGKTIPQADQSKIFQKFFRGSNILDEITGTGLGLHIANEYIKKWGGKISFESPAHFSERSMNSYKYKGTTFSVELPVSAKQVK